MIRKVVLFSTVMVVVGAATAFAAFPPIDLTVAGATYTGTDGVIWNELVGVPTGTGVYNPFLRTQANDVEEGFNTDFSSPPPLDDKAGIWTHSVVLGDLQKKLIGAGEYYVFTLDINEPNNYPSSLLSLDELRLYTSSNAGAATFADYATMVANSTLRYDMDAVAGGQTVYLDHNLQAGSGHDDMEVLIPTSFFAGASLTDNLILYNKFGATGGAFGADFQSADGFEEWSAIMGPNTPPPGAPEPMTLLLLGGGALGLVGAVRRKK